MEEAAGCEQMQDAPLALQPPPPPPPPPPAETPQAADFAAALAYGRPAVQVGSAGWEAALFRASLITDALPPLWVSERLLARQLGQQEEAAAPAGPPSAASSSSRQQQQQQQQRHFEEHPTHGFRLLHFEEPAAAAAGSSGSAEPACSSSSSCSSLGSASKRPRSSWAAEQQAAAGQGPAQPLLEAVDGGSSEPPFAALTAWVLRQASQGLGGESASVRSWKGERKLFQLRQDAAGSAAGSAAAVHCSVFSSLTLYISGARFCAAIQRQHKSNGIFWRLNLESGTAVQGCFDAQCRGFSFPVLRLPQQLLPDQLSPGIWLPVQAASQAPGFTAVSTATPASSLPDSERDSLAPHHTVR
jgi:hypothetical protein